ncbi:MAG: sigma-E processing peptidase SpoIIGA [Oscillospiraceae bacterium]|nr:sigma-E processing peptidase SpoIIGA [Oscillospiraceae bacterium]
MTVVYIDLLFLLNLIANYLLLLAAGRIAGAALFRWRIGLGGSVGALYAALVFLPGLEWLALWPCKLAAGVLMALTAYGGERYLLRVTVVFFGASAALAGAVLGLELLGSVPLTLEHGVFYSQLDIRLLLLVFVACYFVLSLFFRRTGQRAGRELVRLEVALEAGTASVTALVDTGHSLTDPATNRPVVVADATALAGFLPDWADAAAPIQSVERCHASGSRQARLVPYRAVGVECGMLLALRTRGVKADGRPLGELLMALSPTAVDDGGGYQAIIGGI